MLEIPNLEDCFLKIDSVYANFCGNAEIYYIFYLTTFFEQGVYV